MASMIEVRCISDQDPLEFKVVVRDGKGESRHHVTMLGAERYLEPELMATLAQLRRDLLAFAMTNQAFFDRWTVIRLSNPACSNWRRVLQTVALGAPTSQSTILCRYSSAVDIASVAIVEVKRKFAQRAGTCVNARQIMTELLALRG